MKDRRGFFRDVVCAGGLLFVGCHLDAQRPTASRRPPVMVRGRRIRTVDVHAHCAIADAVDLLQRPVNRGTELRLEPESLAARLRTMDAQGVDVEVLSINPNWYDVDRDLAARLIRVQNEGLATFCAAHPERFVALASVALQYPDLAAEQLELGVKQMGLRGVAIGGSVGGHELSDARFHPFWAKAEELGAVVFIHPQPSTEMANRLGGNGNLTNVIWNPLETTIALSHLIFEGTLDRFPGVKICAAHGGGYLPSYVHRSDFGCQVTTTCHSEMPRRHPSDYVRQLYYDSLVFTPEALRHLIAEVGARQVMVGTDYPFPWVTQPIDHILNTPGLTDADREAILGGTAATLFGLSRKPL